MTPRRQNITPAAVVELAVNLDDVTGQLLADAQQRLLEAGALDVWTVAIGMKKQRPGVMLCVLCEPARRDAMARLILRLTGSFGVRFRAWDRMVLDRWHETLDTRFGKVRVKIGRLDAEVVAAQPEHDDVKRIADGAGVTFCTAMQAAMAAAETWRVAQRPRQASPARTTKRSPTARIGKGRRR